ncbi:MAG: hypothetical protein ABFS37_08015 [Acidobacteriota bacterium]
MQKQNPVQVMDSDGLVVIPAAETAPVTRLVRSVVIVVFSILIFGTPIVDLMAPAPEIKLMGEERKRDVRLRKAARPWDGSLFRLWEHDLRMRSGIRRWATDQYGWVLYRWLGHVQSAIVVGDGGWLFLKARVQVPDGLETAYVARRASASMAALYRRLAAHELESVFVPIPRKAALLSDDLPPNLEARPEVDRSIIDDLGRRGLPTVDLWPAFADELEEPPYHLLGSHWTDEAQLVAANAVGVRSGRVVSPSQRTTTVSQTESGLSGAETDLLQFGGLGNRHTLPETADRMSLIVRDNLGRLKRGPVREPGDLVVVGSSFSAGRKFSTFVSHLISDPVYNGAQAGRFPGSTLAEFLRNRAWKGLTEVVVVETPNHHLIQDPVGRLVSPPFAGPPPKPLLRHFSLESDLLPADALNGFTVMKPQKLAKIEPGRLGHTGDGVVGVRVRGRVDEIVRLRLVPVGGEEVVIHWRPGVRDVVLPLISADPLAGSVWLAISPGAGNPAKAAVTIKSIEVVSEVGPQPRFNLVAGKVAKTDDGWESWIDVPEAVLSPTALLKLELGAKGKFVRNLAIEVQPSGNDEPLQAEWTDLTRGTLVVVSLARFAGRTLERIRVSGTGPLPRKPIHRAVLRAGK